MLAQTDHSHPRHLALPSPIPSNTGPTHSEVGLFMNTWLPGPHENSMTWRLPSLRFGFWISTSTQYKLCCFYHRITECPELEGTLKDHWVQLLVSCCPDPVWQGFGEKLSQVHFSHWIFGFIRLCSTPPPPISSTLPKRSPGISSWSRGFIPSRHFRLYFSLLMDFLDTGVQSHPENSQKTKVILFPNQYPWLAVT